MADGVSGVLAMAAKGECGRDVIVVLGRFGFCPLERHTWRRTGSDSVDGRVTTEEAIGTSGDSNGLLKALLSMPALTLKLRAQQVTIFRTRFYKTQLCDVY